VSSSVKVKQPQKGKIKASMVKRIVDLNRLPPAIRVGVFGSGSYDSGITVQELAAIHIHGLGKMPARDFLGGWQTAKRQENRDLISKVCIQVAKGKMPASQGTYLIGESLVGGVRLFMAAGIAPAKADGSTCTLIDNGTLRAAVGWQV